MVTSNGVRNAIEDVFYNSRSVITDLDDAPKGLSCASGGATNNPYNFWIDVFTITSNNSNYIQQFIIPWAGNTFSLAYRVKDNGTWRSWRQYDQQITSAPITSANSNIAIIGAAPMVKFGLSYFISLLFRVDAVIATNTTILTLPYSLSSLSGNPPIFKASATSMTYSTVALKNNTQLYVNYSNGISSTGFYYLFATGIGTS